MYFLCGSITLEEEKEVEILESIIQRMSRTCLQMDTEKLHFLGQNVDSYLWYGGGAKKDFKKATDKAKENSLNFSDY